MRFSSLRPMTYEVVARHGLDKNHTIQAESEVGLTGRGFTEMVELRQRLCVLSLS